MTAPVEVDPLPPRQRGPGIRQTAYCPTCTRPVGSLLAGCNQPLCRRADLDYDAALERLLDS